MLNFAANVGNARVSTKDAQDACRLNMVDLNVLTQIHDLVSSETSERKVRVIAGAVPADLRGSSDGLCGTDRSGGNSFTPSTYPR